MNEEELYPDQSGSLENLRHMRLMALLRDMIEDQRKVKAAKALGVNFRTLVRAEESGQLTARMSAELERHLLLGGVSAASRQRESIRALEERLGRNLKGLRGVVEKATAKVREEQAQGTRRLEWRPARGGLWRRNTPDRRVVEGECRVHERRGHAEQGRGGGASARVGDRVDREPQAGAATIHVSLGQLRQAESTLDAQAGRRARWCSELEGY